MKILIVAPFCSLPNEGAEGRFVTLSKMACERGWDVTLVTSNFRHENKTFRDLEKVKFSDKIKLILIDELGYKKNISIKRIASHFYFSLNLMKILYFGDSLRINSYDIVYLSIPFNINGILFSLLKNGYRYKLILDVQDIWPEAFEILLGKMKFLLLPMKVIPYISFKAADGIVAVSSTYLNIARNYNTDSLTRVVYLGSNIEKINEVSEHVVHMNDVYKFFYIGTLGYSYDLITVVSAFNNIVVNGRRCELHIFGSGPMKDSLESISSSNVIYHGFVEWGLMYKIIGKMDFAINPIKKMAAQSITNKISDYISLGYPILSCQESLELDELLVNQPYLKYQAGSVASLINAIKLMCPHRGEMINDSIREKFVRKTAYNEILNFIEFLK